ncbi:hypothetical protein AB0C88_16290 [Streptomyces chartreusis]|uniref:hypothetical protein n=1 Tax=Streptomyces chartreusis TaxID=1969 RepID=UPI0033EE1747
MNAVLIANDDTSTCQAAAAFIAGKIYDAALAAPNPAEALDNICDALPEIMADLLHTMGLSSEVSSTLHTELADRLWAFTRIAHARADINGDYAYALDVLAESLKRGTAPHTVRAEVPRLVARVLAVQADGAR